MSTSLSRGLVLAAALTLATASVVSARPIARAGGVRAAAPTSINRGGNVGNRVGNTNVVNRGGNNVHVGNNNINVDVDRGWDNGHYHPVAAGVAFGTAAAITTAAVGSMIYSLPPACAMSPYGGYSYYSCGGVWYEPRYQGDSVTYVVVNNPAQ